MQTGSDDPASAGSNLLRLPVRAQRIAPAAAALYLGMSQARLRALKWLNVGPAIEDNHYRIDELDAYLARLYRRADISEAEMLRRNHLRAPQRRAALSGEGLAGKRPPGSRQAVPQRGADPFIRMATRGELAEQAFFLTLRTMVLFGLITLAVSISPLAHVHF